MEENVFSRQRFEVFKGNVYNRIKEYGQIGFIKKILLSDNMMLGSKGISHRILLCYCTKNQ